MVREDRTIGEITTTTITLGREDREVNKEAIRCKELPTKLEDF